jgi:ribonuclease E
MPKRMLIDAAHPEETRVVVTSGHRLEEFDFESSTKRQVKGNIYLAKVTRVEPSLQACFIDYGGNRHGFLAFSEIHPDYHRIPVGDRAPSEPETPSDSARAPDNDGEDAATALAAVLPEPVAVPEPSATEDDPADDEIAADGDHRADSSDGAPEEEPEEAAPPGVNTGDVGWIYAPGMEPQANSSEPAEAAPAPADAAPVYHAPIDHAPIDRAPVDHAPVDRAPVDHAPVDTAELAAPLSAEGGREEVVALHADRDSLLAAELGEPVDGSDQMEPEGAAGEIAESESVETLGGDEVEEVEEADAEHRRSHPVRHYKIQEVIKRRQIMLVQVAKEERGNKGAALTTYLSLAGRYCVLMPNTGRGGGVSRKINSLSDRRRLKEILEELDIPEGMGVIVRTAGAERSKAEIKRDYEYLLRLWNEIRDLTLKSTAPALIYEEGNLIKRSIRDLYTRDIDEVLVEGEEGYKTAKAFMRTLMPSHAKRVQPYRDPQMPLLQRFQVESQIDAIHSPVAQLRSGAYIVINQTEALVAIDVNSGRSTRERNIEETALRTNLEAADEIARQLRLRDLAGLIVIDFIDMEEHRNQTAVERRMKEALKNDRARIQVGRISPFGLLEMSRQRLRPSLAEASTQPCPHCGGTGLIRSVESTALYVLRSIEEEGIHRRSAEICVYVPTNVALYILNQKRDSLAQIEQRYGVKVTVARDDTLIPPSFRLERLRTYEAGEAPPLRAIQAPVLLEEAEETEEVEAEEAFEPAEVEAEPAADVLETEAGKERARRRRRRPRRRPEEAREARRPAAVDEATPVAAASEEEERERDAEAERRRRRRGRRGGRVRPRREEPSEPVVADLPHAAAETVEVLAAEEPHTVEFEDHEPAPAPWSSEMAIETASLAPLAGEEVDPRRGGDVEEAAAAAEPAPTGERETGIPFTSEFEREIAGEPAIAAAPAEPPVPEPAEEAPTRRDENVLTVNEKPANPRRGWWQRLMQ